MNEDDKILYESAKKALKIGSMQELAKLLCYAETTANNWYNNGFNEKVRLKINAKIQEYSNNTINIVAEPTPKYGEISLDDMVVVNVYPDVYASAGLGNALSESTSHQTLMDKNLLRDVFNVRNFNNLDMIKVIGDSMSPIINDGEVLFIERGAHAKNGDTVIVTLNDELYVKRFFKDPFGEWVRLESENKDFPHIELNSPQKIAMLNIIGIARSKVKVY